MKLPEPNVEVLARCSAGRTNHWRIMVHDSRSWYTTDGDYIEDGRVLFWLELPNAT